ncbi:MAG TPA: PP2C family protein-serine/threonine phosphatase [Acidobacteriaceae bacterium]|nr:PP2C family protein-serine/threonine phosphatase [Acidobacteriaceae bacterium]
MTAFTWFAARLRLTLASAAPKLCMRRHAIACLATFFTFYPACSRAPAQTSPVAWPNGSVDINSGWRAQDGDNLAWAQPGFDDSSWPIITLNAANNTAGWRWYRLGTNLPATPTPLALLITAGRGTFEVYLNGQRLPGPGIQSDLLITYPRSQVVYFPPSSGAATIALRTWIPPTSMFFADRGALRVLLGTQSAIYDAHRAETSTRFDKLVAGLAIYLLVLFAGLSLLLLFWFQPHHREYLWLGIYFLLGDGLNAVCFILSSYGFTPFCLVWFVSTPANYLQLIAMIEFTFSFVGQRVTRPVRAYEALLVLWPLCFLLPAWFGVITRNFYNIVEAGLFLPASIFVPVLLLSWYRRGNREAGWLIFPSPLPLLTLCLSDVGVLGESMGSRRLAIFDQQLPVGGFAISFFEAADLLFLLAIGVVMFFRFTRVSREQARSAAELQAAREIQQRLVPVSLPRIAGYALQAAYLPAQEVGGDFYQVLEQRDGATLIVIGDVSGKGLKAAMTGTLAIGALRSLADEDLGPAVLLNRLNREMLRAQDGGFITCLCARLATNATVTVANAGHLPPFRNGDEITLESALPLGLTSEAVFPETTLCLAPGDSLTFLSDGVVEARNPTGELYGFDRTRAISTQSAQQIARAAQQFGQEDDITVLTLTFTGAEVPHA